MIGKQAGKAIGGPSWVRLLCAPALMAGLAVLVSWQDWREYGGLPAIEKINREYAGLPQMERSTLGLEGVLHRVSLTAPERDAVLLSRRQGHLYFSPESGWRLQLYPWEPTGPEFSLVPWRAPAIGGGDVFAGCFFLVGVFVATGLGLRELDRVGGRFPQKPVC